MCILFFFSADVRNLWGKKRIMGQQLPAGAYPYRKQLIVNSLTIQQGYYAFIFVM